MADRPILIGKFLSPYVRRVGITLTCYGFAFERLVVSAVTDREVRERYNPTGRVPALVLPGGETLIDSAAIIDHFDERAGDGSLVPPRGPERRRVLQQIALATGTIDRLMGANAERRRPPDKHMPERLEAQHTAALAGFEALEGMLDGASWFGEAMGQGDLTAAVALSFADHVFPGLVDPTRVPALDAMRARCEATEPFRACAID